MKFDIYESVHRHYVVEADSYEDAYDMYWNKGIVDKDKLDDPRILEYYGEDHDCEIEER